MKLGVFLTLGFSLTTLVSPLSLKAQNQVRSHNHFFGVLPTGISYVDGKVYGKHRITFLLVNPQSSDVDCNVNVDTRSTTIFSEFPVVVPAGGSATRSIPYDFAYTEAKGQVLCNGNDLYAIAQYEVLRPDDTVQSSVDLHSVTWDGRSADVRILYPPNTATHLLLGAQAFPERVTVGFDLYVEVLLNTGRVLSKRIWTGSGFQSITNFFIENEFWPEIPDLGSPVSVHVRSVGIPSNAFTPSQPFAMGAIFWNPSGSYSEATVHKLD